MQNQKCFEICYLCGILNDRFFFSNFLIHLFEFEILKFLPFWHTRTGEERRHKGNWSKNHLSNFGKPCIYAHWHINCFINICAVAWQKSDCSSMSATREFQTIRMSNTFLIPIFFKCIEIASVAFEKKILKLTILQGFFLLLFAKSYNYGTFIYFFLSVQFIA